MAVNAAVRVTLLIRFCPYGLFSNEAQINNPSHHCQDYISVVLMLLSKKEKPDSKVYSESGLKKKNVDLLNKVYLDTTNSVSQWFLFVYFNEDEVRRWFSNRNNYPNPREQQQFSKQPLALNFFNPNHEMFFSRLTD